LKIIVRQDHGARENSGFRIQTLGGSESHHSKRGCSFGEAQASESGDRDQQQQNPENIGVAAMDHSGDEQRRPSVPLAQGDAIRPEAVERSPDPAICQS